MTKLTHLTIKEAITGLKNKDFSSAELTASHMQAMEKHSDLNAYITPTLEIAKEAALKADQVIASGQDYHNMTGIPVAVKDLFCTKDVLTTSGSKMLSNFIPAYESTVSSKLLEAGAVMLGKANMDEFAMGSSNLTSFYGGVKNPWKANNSDSVLVPGGSSGGSAVAVAAFTAMGSLGSDTGGSIRQPASYCGIVGMKPSYGRCSRYGMIAFSSSLDQAGVFNRSVTDAAIMLEAIMGYDSKDSTCLNMPVPDLEAQLRAGVKNMKIGIPREYNVDGMSNEISVLWQKGIKWLQEAGAEIIEISLPHTKYALPVYYIIAPAEASSNLARFDGVRYGFRADDAKSIEELYEATRQHGFGPEVKRRIMIGTYVLSSGHMNAYFLQAQKVRRLIADDFTHAFNQVDAILVPSAPSAAFAADIKITDPVTMYLNDVFTIPASLAGLPCISVPAGLSGTGLPLGLQVIAKAFAENTVLKVAKAIEDAAGFKGLEG